VSIGKYKQITYLMLGLGIGSMLYAQGELKEVKPSVDAYAKGEAIVVWKKNISTSTLSTLLGQKKIMVKKQYQALSSKARGTFMLVSGEESTEALVARLKKDSHVLSVSPNYRRTLKRYPNDPKFDQLWGLENTGQLVKNTRGTAGADIDAPKAWDKSVGTSETVVAVFDTGVDYTHEDLVDNMWVNRAEASGTRGVDDDGNGYVDDVYGYDVASTDTGENDPDPMDIMGHGSHVSGTIGASGNNGIGMSGINWAVNIMALKVFRPNMGGYDSDILEAIEYVLKMKEAYGVNIVAINASYGGSCGTNFQQDPMNDAIKSLGDAGIVFVAAAGNESSNNESTPSCPASYDADNIIVVAATDQDDTLASFSNYGEISVDMAAPGTNILSTLPSFAMPEHGIYFDDVENGEGDWNGTGNWAITQEEFKSPSHAWSDSPHSNYPNNAESILRYERDIDLLAYQGQRIGLGSCMLYALEEGYDYLYIEASGDSGVTWRGLGSITGSSENQWQCQGLFIPEYLKTGHFRMRFRLVSDDSVTEDGVYIDNISIGAMAGSEKYAYWNGTSMATPHVTGAVALMASVYPEESAKERKERILKGVDILESLKEKVATQGRLNIATSLALPKADTPPIEPETPQEEIQSSGGGCSYNPHTKSIDVMMVLMVLMSLLYPFRGKLLK